MDHLATIEVSPFAQNTLSSTKDMNKWARQADLNWNISSSPLLYKDPDSGVTYQDRDKKVLFRSDNKLNLGIVGKNFNPVQPKQILEFYSDLANRLDINLEAAGHVKGGSLIWGLADLSENFRLMGQDEIQSHLMFSTANDGTRATNIFFISKRIICNNMLNFAFNEADNSPFYVKLRHTQEVNKKVLDDILEDVVYQRGKHWKNFQLEAECMAETRMSVKQVSDYFADLLSVKGEDGEIYVPERNIKIIDNLAEVYNNGVGQDTRSAKGTAWGALNAVTRYIDHEVSYRSNETKLYNSQFSVGKDLKNKAFRLASDIAQAA